MPHIINPKAFYGPVILHGVTVWLVHGVTVWLVHGVTVSCFPRALDQPRDLPPENNLFQKQRNPIKAEKYQRKGFD